MRKITVVFLVSGFVAALCVWNTGYAEELTMKGKLGIGIQSNLLNFGLGPTVEYFPVENFSVSGNIGALGDLTSYGIRGNYYINKTELYRPYLGAGYSQINGPLDTNGSGLELYGGLLQLASENLGFRGEVIYSTIEFESIDFGSFSFGVAVTYFF